MFQNDPRHVRPRFREHGQHQHQHQHTTTPTAHPATTPTAADTRKGTSALLQHQQLRVRRAIAVQIESPRGVAPGHSPKTHPYRDRDQSQLSPSEVRLVLPQPSPHEPERDRERERRPQPESNGISNVVSAFTSQTTRAPNREHLQLRAVRAHQNFNISSSARDLHSHSTGNGNTPRSGSGSASARHSIGNGNTPRSGSASARHSPDNTRTRSTRTGSLRLISKLSQSFQNVTSSKGGATPPHSTRSRSTATPRSGSGAGAAASTRERPKVFTFSTPRAGAGVSAAAPSSPRAAAAAAASPRERPKAFTFSTPHAVAGGAAAASSSARPTAFTFPTSHAAASPRSPRLNSPTARAAVAQLAPAVPLSLASPPGAADAGGAAVTASPRTPRLNSPTARAAVAQLAPAVPLSLAHHPPGAAAGGADAQAAPSASELLAKLHHPPRSGPPRGKSPPRRRLPKRSRHRLAHTRVPSVASSQEEKPQKTKVSFRELFRFAESSDTKWIVLGVLASMVNGVSYPVSAVLFGGITDAAGSSVTNPDFMDDVIWNCAALAVLGVVQFLSATLAVSSWTIVAERLAQRTREEFLRRTLHQDIAWFAEKSHALILNRLNKDGSLFASGIGEKMSMLIINVCTMLTGLTLGLYYCWQVAGLFLGSLPIIAAVVIVVLKKLRRVGNKSNEINNRASALALDALDAIRTVTAFGGQGRELKEYRETLEEATPFAMSRGRLKGLMMGSIFFNQLTVMASCFLLGSYLIRTGTISQRTGEVLTGGDIFAALFLIVFGLLGIMRLAPALPAISGARSAAFRLFEVIDRQSPIDASSDEGITPKSFSGGITFDKVVFSYPGRRRRVLRGFSTKFQAGKTTAIVGASGCGKSTALALIERFFDIKQVSSAVTAAEQAIEGTGDRNRGAVKIDGINIADVNLKWWRSKIGYVSQSAQLFSGTIRENIAFGYPGASQRKIERAAKIAHAHTFITELEKGYDTEIGDDGALLSGGQRQRIALARAIVRDPPVLLLDEVTAALDNQSEREVLIALRSVMHKRTTIVVAHRLSTIQNADKIIVLEAGRVCEQGTHKQLLERRGKYYTLISAQNDMNDSLNSPTYIDATIVDPTLLPTTAVAHASPADPYSALTSRPQFVSPRKRGSMSILRRGSMFVRKRSDSKKRGSVFARRGSENSAHSSVGNGHAKRGSGSVNVGNAKRGSVSVFMRKLSGANNPLSNAESMLEHPLAAAAVAHKTSKPQYIDAEIGDAVTETGDIESGNPMGLATFLQAPRPVYVEHTHSVSMSVNTVNGFESVEPEDDGDYPATIPERSGQRSGTGGGANKTTDTLSSTGSSVSVTDLDIHVDDMDTLRSIPEHHERDREDEEERRRHFDDEEELSVMAGSVQRAFTYGGVGEPSRSEFGFRLGAEMVNGRGHRRPSDSFASIASLSSSVSLTKPKPGCKSKGGRVDHVPLRRVLALTKSDRKWIAGGTIAAALHGCAHPTYAFFMSSMWAVLYDDPESINEQIFTFAMFILAAGAAWFVMSFATRACFVVVGERLTFHLRVEAYRSLLRQEMAFFDDPQNSAEVLTSHLENQAAKVNEPLSDSLPTIVRIISQLVVGIAIGSLFSWRIALVTLAISPVLIMSKFINSRRATYADDGSDNRNEDAGAQRIAGEATRHIRTIAAFSLEESTVKRYATALVGEVKGGIRNGVKVGMKNGIGSFNLYICYAFLSWFGASLIEQGVIEFMDMLRALLVVLLCVAGIGDLGLVALDFRKARQAIDNIFYIIDRKSAIDPSDPSGKRVPDSFDMTTPYKHISFDDVIFKYDGREDNVIERVSFELARGGSLAVVGQSGCGKSTIIKLLLRFYDAQNGSVNLNKRDIKSYNLKSLRSQISLVEQNSKLFNRSIRENIRYARPDASDADVEEAAKVAAVHDDINDFPDGYNTLCGKGGEKLSGGQKQRVAIARAILKNTQLLLLDEATSALDSQSEAAVQNSLNKLMRHNGHATTVMIAHRLSTVQNCDCILVLKEGKIVEVGSHLQLLEHYPEGTYAKLCRASLALTTIKR